MVRISQVRLSNCFRFRPTSVNITTVTATKENLFYIYLHFCIPFAHYLKGQEKENLSRTVALFSLYEFLKIKYSEHDSLCMKIGIDKLNNALFRE